MGIGFLSYRHIFSESRQHFPLAFGSDDPYNKDKLLTLSISLRERCRHRVSAAWISMGMFSVAAPVRGGNFHFGGKGLWKHGWRL
jgi:hypothetical protein